MERCNEILSCLRVWCECVWLPATSPFPQGGVSGSSHSAISQTAIALLRLLGVVFNLLLDHLSGFLSLLDHDNVGSSLRRLP